MASREKRRQWQQKQINRGLRIDNLKDSPQGSKLLFHHEHLGRGKASGLLVMTREIGASLNHSPAVSLAYRIRAALRPLLRNPVTIFDGDGKPIARVIYDANGEKTRVPYDG